MWVAGRTWLARFGSAWRRFRLAAVVSARGRTTAPGARGLGMAASALEAVATGERLVAAVELHHRAAVERLLAFARAGAATVLAVVLAAPRGPAHVELAHIVAAAYALYALAVLAGVMWKPPLRARTGLALHFADLGWITVVSALSGGVSSHAYPLFTFVIIAAGYRWGMRRTAITAGLVIGIAGAEAAASAAGLTPWSFEPDLFLLRVAYTAVLAVLVGVLSQGQLALRYQALAAGGLMSRLGRHTLLIPGLRGLLIELVEVFGAARAMLVVEDRLGETPPSLWQARAQRAGSSPVFSSRELEAGEAAAWFCPLPPELTAYEARLAPGATTAVATLGLMGSGSLTHEPFELPAAVGREGGWHTLLASCIESTERWRARLYVLDPALKPGGYVRLGFLRNLAIQVGPPLLNLYLLRQLREAAAASERARVARELHDGAIQTMAALQLRLEVLRRRATAANEELAHEVERVQQDLKDGTAEIRELVDLLRPVQVDAQGLGAALADLVARFGRNHGVEATFACEAERVRLGHRQSREAYRLAQEALVNVRRHSGATHVGVRLTVDAHTTVLVVEDNGRGLGFQGRLTHEQLAASSKGPRILRERVEQMGGLLFAESSTQGTRLEMAFPHDTPE